jgi:hypothetical protein
MMDLKWHADPPTNPYPHITMPTITRAISLVKYNVRAN